MIDKQEALLISKTIHGHQLACPDDSDPVAALPAGEACMPCSDTTAELLARVTRSNIEQIRAKFRLDVGGMVRYLLFLLFVLAFAACFGLDSLSSRISTLESQARRLEERITFDEDRITKTQECIRLGCWTKQPSVSEQGGIQ